MMVSKAVLYEPVKELCDKFPAWMQSNSASTPPDDLERYDTAAVFCFCRSGTFILLQLLPLR